jgi:hypothetical protein
VFGDRQRDHDTVLQWQVLLHAHEIVLRHERDKLRLEIRLHGQVQRYVGAVGERFQGRAGCVSQHGQIGQQRVCGGSWAESMAALDYENLGIVGWRRTRSKIRLCTLGRLQ